MNCVDELRKQLPRSEFRDGYNFKAVEAVLGKSAMRFLYAPQYVPSLATVKKLVDAGMVSTPIPVEPGAYVALLAGRDQATIKAVLQADPIQLSYGILKPIWQGKEVNLKFTTAYALWHAVQRVDNGEIEIVETKVWTNEKEDFLTENYPKVGAATCAKELGFSRSAVETKASRMGLKRVAI